jgi:hypothetical protein
MCDGQISATIYQNIKDPKAHSLEPTDTARAMWVLLNAKFGRKSEVLKGLAMQRLRGLKLADGSSLPQHLDKLTTLRADYTHVGGHILDPEMNLTIIQSLPILEFHGDIMRLGRLTVTFEMESELLTYWEQVYGETAVANVLAATANGLICTNCPVAGHTKDHCWTRGGGKEGHAPRRWSTPVGLEPRQHIVEVARAAKTAKWNVKVAAAAAVVQVAALAPTPVPTPPTPTTTAVFTSPMTIYNLATVLDDEEGACQTYSSGAVGNRLRRTGCGGTFPLILLSVSRTVPDVVPHLVSIYTADIVVHATGPCFCYTFLDSGASEHCFVNH